MSADTGSPPRTLDVLPRPRIRAGETAGRGWPHVQLRHLFDVVSGATPESGKAGHWDGDVLWVTPEDVGALNDSRLADTRRKITNEGYASCGTTLVPANSIVLTKRAPIGQLAILDRPMCCNQGCFLLVPNPHAAPRFYYYVLLSRMQLLQALGCGSTFMELSTDNLKALQLPIPPSPSSAPSLTGWTAKRPAWTRS